MKQYYIYDELKRKTYYDLHKICVDEKLIEGFRENLNRSELINIILKYRSREKVYGIDSYKENGIERLQELFDTRLGFKLNDSNSIKIPHKVVIYKDMPLSDEDDYKITIPEHISDNNIFLMNGNSYLCGIFQLSRNKSERNSFFIRSDEKLLRLENLKNQNYSLIFSTEAMRNFYSMLITRKKTRAVCLCL
ncbi:Uncharacterised protein [Fusobacterium varium]|nr:hypothetical protein [Fusobacterium varium]VEH39072.1 Uncharacterised protein [Fusobacterium varium]